MFYLGKKPAIEVNVDLRWVRTELCVCAMEMIFWHLVNIFTYWRMPKKIVQTCSCLCAYVATWWIRPQRSHLVSDLWSISHCLATLHVFIPTFFFFKAHTQIEPRSLTPIYERFCLHCWSPPINFKFCDPWLVSMLLSSSPSRSGSLPSVQIKGSFHWWYGGSVTLSELCQQLEFSFKVSQWGITHFILVDAERFLLPVTT